ncbi:MAG: polysaccharide deacetylase family protein [Bacteroidales bacterium]|nr:polysaccharide deacetylase family protein [Bacteroidales bacterium]
MESGTIKIFATANAPRLRYIAGIILEDILGLEWELITDRRKLGKHTVINYSGMNISGAFKITPDPLLFETGISAREISVTEWHGLPVFFQATNGSDLPFDIFAASFFLLSRYEEYLYFQPDEHGRFRASDSLAFRNGFLDRPVIDLWTKEFAKALLKKFQTIAFRRNEFSALVTIDADEPFAYPGKSRFGSLGGFFRDIAQKTGLSGRKPGRTLTSEKDPFDVFDYIDETIERFGADPIFFFPVGDPSEYDKNPPYRNEDYQELILRISGKYPTGIHPSYHSAENASVMITETGRLKSLLGTEITRNRFHYLRIAFPRSFSSLGDAGITEDYSMGYPDEPGFRAGIARPYFFYNVIKDEATTLRIIPFQVMDCTLSGNKGLDPESAKLLIRKIIKEVMDAGGTFVSIWHNTSLLDTPDCIRWREVFEYTLTRTS